MGDDIVIHGKVLTILWLKDNQIKIALFRINVTKMNAVSATVETTTCVWKWLISIFLSLFCYHHARFSSCDCSHGNKRQNSVQSSHEFKSLLWIYHNMFGIKWKERVCPLQQRACFIMTSAAMKLSLHSKPGFCFIGTHSRMSLIKLPSGVYIAFFLSFHSTKFSKSKRNSFSL